MKNEQTNRVEEIRENKQDENQQKGGVRARVRLRVIESPVEDAGLNKKIIIRHVLNYSPSSLKADRK